MSIVIEQEETDIKLSFDVHRNAEIARVRLVRAGLFSNQLADAPEERIGVQIAFEATENDSPPGILRLQVAFKMEGFSGAEPVKRRKKAEPTTLVECTYEVDYKLNPGFQPTAEQTRAFRQGNAVFNLWPYFREFLQSHITAMGLPPFTAPFLRMQPKLNAPQQAKNNSSEAPARKSKRKK